MADRIALARSAFERGAWRHAFTHLGEQDTLDLDDLERLAVAAHLAGEVRACELAWERAHRLAASRGDADRAARCAFWLGFDLLLREESARASGWFARAERLAEEAPHGVAAGFLLIPPFLGLLDAGDGRGALDLATQITAIGQRCTDKDLLAFGLLCQGEALIIMGEPAEGMRRLDEAMVSVTTGELSPMSTGIVYCAVIDACMHAHDLRRAAEWTEALAMWCASDPSLVPYRGQCLVHRAQVLTARGRWVQAVEEADRAIEHLRAIEHPALGYALYQRGELCRLRGQFADAEVAYRAASGVGREPMPGLGLLRLAQGRAKAATTAAQRMLRGSPTDPDRPAILAAAIEILLATGALDEAAVACEELEQRAGAFGTAVVPAAATTARAALLLARGDASGAAHALRDAIGMWRSLDLPFEQAKARALMSRACTALGDVDGAQLERDAARAAFESLGAQNELSRFAPSSGTEELSRRECDVIRLVAAGRTNREIAGELMISEHTVARHVQNIFTKIGVSTRAAAGAYAYEHGIV